MRPPSQRGRPCVVGGAIEGTLGRTAIGKKLGLNDVNIPSVPMNTLVHDMDMFGKGGTKGFKETKEEKDKRIREREEAVSGELAIAQAKEDVNKGANADPATPAGIAAIEAMEKALAKLSDKQIEALVAGNRKLLESQNFANTISVKQLETLNKSEQFSESEKSMFKGIRFSSINTAMAAPAAVRPDAVGGVATNIKALADSELEMVDPAYLGDKDFVSQLRLSQVESIIKSNKFTTRQKEAFKTSRKQPLLDALAANNLVNAQNAVRKLGHKEVAALDMPTLLHPTMLQVYSAQMLTRMVQEMNPADVGVLRAAIIAAPGAPAAVWLGQPAGQIFS